MALRQILGEVKSFKNIRAQAPAQLQQKMDELLQNIKYDAVWFVGWRTKHLERKIAYTKLQVDRIVQLAEAQLRLELIEEELEIKKRLTHLNSEARFQAAELLVETEIAKRRLNEAAIEFGLTTEAYTQYRLTELSSELKVTEAWKMNDVDVEKQRRLKEIDFQHESNMRRMQIDSTIEFEQRDIASAHFVLQRLMQAKKELYNLQYSGEPLRLIEAQAKDYVVFIRGLESKLAGLLQGETQKDFRGDDENTDPRRITGKDVEGGEE